MKKIDLKKEFATLYKASAGKPVLVDVPPLNYLMIDGTGDPNQSQQFQDAIEALYTLSYTIKFMFKKGPEQIDYGVMPLEGLWWTDEIQNFSMKDKSAWKWTLMIMQPEFVSKEIVLAAKEQASKKKDPALLKKVRLEKMQEGLSAQVLYIGPYNEEPPTIEQLHAFIIDKGYKLHGKHREIYLNDMRKTAPDKLKTIIRQPVKE